MPPNWIRMGNQSFSKVVVSCRFSDWLRILSLHIHLLSLGEIFQTSGHAAKATLLLPGPKKRTLSKAAYGWQTFKWIITMTGVTPQANLVWAIDHILRRRSTRFWWGWYGSPLNSLEIPFVYIPHTLPVSTSKPTPCNLVDRPSNPRPIQSPLWPQQPHSDIHSPTRLCHQSHVLYQG